MDKTHAPILVVPARLQSSRIPNKLLRTIGNETLIRRCITDCNKTGYKVILVTDSETIASEVSDICEVTFSENFHLTGTSRVAEATQYLDEDQVVVNVQGDQIGIQKDDIDALVFSIKNSVGISSLFEVRKDYNDFIDPSNVKLVVNKYFLARYFSRAAIPFVESEDDFEQYFNHVGIYCFRNSVLQKIVEEPTDFLSQTEHLEQLNWLFMGYQIKMVNTMSRYHSFNTEQDFSRFGSK